MRAIPYCGPAPEPDSLFAAWNLDGWLIAALALLGWALRGERLRVKLGFALLVLAYVSPLCALSAGLFSARALHHLVIVFLAAPLLAEALRSGRVPLWPAFLAHVAVFWLWHLPAAYEWALSSDLAYWAGQVALLGSAVLLWNALARRDVSVPVAILLVLLMAMQTGLLGALLTFAPVPLYAPHFLTTIPYGLAVIEDQQLAGLLMWVGSLPLTALAAWSVLDRLHSDLRRPATA